MSDSNRPDTARARFWLGVGLPAVIVVATYLPFLLYRSRLPDRVASHFDGAGRADGSMTVSAFVGVTGVVVVTGLALSVALAIRRSPLPAGLGASTGFLGPFVAALGGGILATTVVSQRDLDDWTRAPSVWWSLPAVFAGAVLAGMFGARLGSRLAAVDSDLNARNAPIMDLGDGEQAVWVASIRSTPLLLLGIGFAGVGLVLVVATELWLGVVVLVSALPLTALATAHVRVDRSGLQVRYGWLPWPRTSIPVDRIVAASMIDVRPSQWGGWGYRGSLKLANQAAVVLRAGPGIRLDLTDGKVFVVTIEDPETGVALLNAQVQRSVNAS